MRDLAKTGLWRKQGLSGIESVFEADLYEILEYQNAQAFEARTHDKFYPKPKPKKR